MDSESVQSQSISAAIRRYSLLPSYGLILAAILVLAGWQWRIPLLRGQILGSFVAPNTALGFALCGISILLQVSPRRWLAGIGIVFGPAVAIFGFLTLLEHLTGLDLNIDHVFFAHRLGDWWLPTPGRIAITSSVAFTAAGIGLVFLRKKAGVPVADLAACIVLGVSYIGIVGYMFGFRLFYGRIMAAPTAVLFALLGLAMLCTSSAASVVTALSSPRLGGFLVRRLTAAILFVTPVLAAIETWFENQKLVNPESGMAILVLTVVGIFTTLVLRTAAVMNSIDEAQEAAQRRATALSDELGALIEASPVGIIRFRRDRTVSNWSAAAERMLGWKAEEILGKQLPVAPNSSHDWSELVAKLATGASLANIETKQVRKDGSIMDALVSGAPIHSAAGGTQEFIGVIMDSTELKLAKDALIRTEKLSAAGRLAASIAHEINNPLEAVTNLLYLARSSKEKAQDYIALADEELARVTHLTKQTLGFYRDSGAPEMVDISLLVEGVLNIYQSKMKRNQIRVVKDLRATEKISTVAGEVRQVISNLLANAIDACPVKGVIHLRTKQAPVNGSAIRGVWVTIGDTGSGIDPALRGKIWEPFFTTKKDVGTGLGLWVSKQIIDKHAGFIRFRSSAQGTVFWLFLPSMAAPSLSRVIAG